MRVRSKLLGLGLAVTILAVVLGYYFLKPQGGAFTGILVFGDSLSDVGNVYIFTEKTNPGKPYFEGRFSDGPVWIEVFAEGMGLPALKPSLAGGTNYAFGGARTGNGNRDGKPDIGAQIDEYFKNSNGKISPKELVVVCGGCNDFLRGNPIYTIPNIIDHIKKLANAGGKVFLVSNLPPLGGLPVFTHELPVIIEASMVECVECSIDPQIYKYFENKLGPKIANYLKKWIPSVKEYLPSIKNYLPIVAEEFAKHLGSYTGDEITFKEAGMVVLDSATAISQMYNHYLGLALDDLERTLGIKIYRLDLNKIFEDLAANPEKQGVIHVSVPALDARTHELVPGVDPNEHMFFDGVHPVSKTHKYIGTEALALFK